MPKQLLTVFIHGTLPPIPLLHVPRIRTFFFCPKGLMRVKDLSSSYHICRMMHKLCILNPERFDLDNFYVFGWSGKLSPQARQEAAQELYDQLQALIVTQQCNIRIISHSHGGNVALYLHAIAQKHTHAVTLCIEQLVLLACPVQLQTASLAQHDSSFKAIYSLHSHYDLLQILDPQGLYQFVDTCKHKGVKFVFTALDKLGPLFSERHFNACPHVVQARIQINNRDLLHIEFLLPHFITLLPEILDMLEQQNSVKSHKSQEYIINIQKQKSIA